jgi:predicted phage terminase large subunit-like protein
MAEPPETNDPVFVTQQDLDRLIKELDTGKRLATLSPVKLGEEAGADLARKRFYAFRQLMHPGMRWNWWTREVSDHLEQFYYDMLDGLRPRLALMAPPQHGKTLLITDFIAWLAGLEPNWKTIYASYSDELGGAANKSLQRMIAAKTYRDVFETRIGEQGWRCDQSLIEYVGHRGSFYNVTIDGQVTGKGLNLGVVDDPVKGRREANSKTNRDTVWDWFVDDFYSRLDDKAGMLIIMTRWHVDDLLGRFLERHKGIKVLRYPAIAERDEKHYTWDKDGNATPFIWKAGEPLFPEWKTLEFLNEQRSVRTLASWQALYLQSPIVSGGGVIPINKFKHATRFVKDDVKNSVRYWDKAATADGDGAYTAGVLMHQMMDGTWLISHVARGHWSVFEREQIIKTLAKADKSQFKSYEVLLEQEPGSGGKESAEATIRNLAGFRVSADRPTGDKKTRAEPWVAQVQAGNVSLLLGEWTQAFLDECEQWPDSKHKDQVDAAAGAFNRLVREAAYNTNYRQWAY